MSHAKLSPSGADRWMVCTASVEAEENYPDETSEAAAEGTAAHLLAATVLQCIADGANARAEEYKGKSIWVPDSVDTANGSIERFCEPHDAPPSGWVFEVTGEMCNHVETYVNQVLAEGYDELEVEVPVPVGVVTGELKDDGTFATGTADCIGISYNDDGTCDIGVHDLKYGKSPKGMVQAQENRQMQLYALAAIHRISLLNKVKRVQLFIHQPRLGHAPMFAVSKKRLNEFHRKAVTAAVAIKEGKTEFVPGQKQCFFCRHRADCSAYSDWVQNKVKHQFPVLEEKGPRGGIKAKADHLSSTDLNEAMAVLGAVERWCTAIRVAAAERLKTDRDAMPDWKFVAGRGSRSYRDDVEPTAFFESLGMDIDVYSPRTLLTPAKLEKAMGKKYYDQYIKPLVTMKPGKPSMVSIDDKRPELNAGEDLGFENLDDQFEE